MFVAAVHLALVYALIVGLGIDVPEQMQASLQVFEVPPEVRPPPPRRLPARHATRRPRGAAAPPNIRSRATPVVAPPPVIPLVAPPLIVVAPVAGLGAEARSGAAPVRGPGTGSGGVGTGTGSGDAGTGDGDGGETPLVHIKGRITDADYPEAAAKLGIGGTVHVRFVVGVKGRVTDCRVTRTSGNTALDETTCRLIQQRFRYRPTMNASGKPIPDVVVGEHYWEIGERPVDGR
ncbi:energy transducer TonB [Sphingosinicellaceae bacterium]|nr:energy transducer TonB [Sphingosinicellaceae bacterium]